MRIRRYRSSSPWRALFSSCNLSVSAPKIPLYSRNKEFSSSICWMWLSKLSILRFNSTTVSRSLCSWFRSWLFSFFNLSTSTYVINYTNTYWITLREYIYMWYNILLYEKFNLLTSYRFFFLTWSIMIPRSMYIRTFSNNIRSYNISLRRNSVRRWRYRGLGWRCRMLGGSYWSCVGRCRRSCGVSGFIKPWLRCWRCRRSCGVSRFIRSWSCWSCLVYWS